MHLRAERGDITQVRVDAVVNAANSSLMGGGGVDGAIHRAAGPELLKECRHLRQTRYPDGLPVGEAVAVGAGELPARWVILTAGPDRTIGQTDPHLLASCFSRSLEVAQQIGAASVAFPAVSAGVFGWPPSQVADIAVATARATAASVPDVAEVRFVLFNEEVFADFERALAART